MLVTMLARRLTIAKNHIACAIVITMMNAISHSGKNIAHHQSKHDNMAERFSHCTANLAIFMPSAQKSDIATIINRLVKKSAVHAPIISVSYRGNTISIPLVGTNLLGNGEKQQNEQVQGPNLLGNEQKLKNYRLSMRREFGRRLFTRLPIFFTNPNPLPR